MHLQNALQLFDLPVEKLYGLWRLLFELRHVFVAVGLVMFLAGILVGGAIWLLVTITTYQKTVDAGR